MFRIITGILFGVLFALPVLAASQIEGRARISDGDTLRIGAETVRLFGIDAPEMDQSCTRGGRNWRCGTWARDELKALVRGEKLRCDVKDRDRYGRSVAICFVDDTDIGDIMVRRGAAVAYRQYSLRYVDAEKDAIFARAGLWAGEFISPWDYRKPQALPVQTAPDDCAIKGNISGSGRIYHLPGQEHYDRTRINTGKGERWFCSEAEARSAGWRRARR